MPRYSQSTNGSKGLTELHYLQFYGASVNSI